MATPTDSRYGQIEFAEDPHPIKLECGICLDVLQNPCETTCCGVYFCRACIEQQLYNSDSCPNCRAELSWQVSKGHERLIKQLKVVCKHKDRGCEWVGELGQLEAHLNESSFDDSGCQCVPMVCVYCHEHVLRKDWNQHLNHTQEAGGRYAGCGQLVLECAYGCGRTFERRDLEMHESVCQQEVVDCAYCSLGCQARMSRKDIQAHVEPENHMHMLLTSCITSQQSIYDLSCENRELALRQSMDVDHCYSVIEQRCQQNIQEMQVSVERLNHELSRKCQQNKEEVQVSVDNLHDELEQQCELNKQKMLILIEKVSGDLADTQRKLRLVEIEHDFLKQQYKHSWEVMQMSTENLRGELRETQQNLHDTRVKHHTVKHECMEKRHKMQSEIDKLQSEINKLRLSLYQLESKSGWTGNILVCLVCFYAVLFGVLLPVFLGPFIG